MLDVADIAALLPAGGASVLLMALATKIALRWLRASDDAIEVQAAVIDELREELNRLAATYRDNQLVELEEDDETD